MRRVAVGILVLMVLVAAATNAQDAERLLKAAMNTELVDGDLKAAIAQYQKVVDSGNRVLAAQALVRMAECYQKLGDSGARLIYERLVREFGDQPESVAVARARLRAPTPKKSAGITVKALPQSNVLPGGISADGRYMTFTSWSDDQLYVRDLRTGTDRVLTQKSDGNIGTSVISGDATSVIYQSFARGCQGEAGLPALCLVSLSTKGVPASKVVVESEDILEITPMAWSADNRTVAVSMRRQDRTAQIGLVTVADGAIRVLQSVDWRGPTRIFFSPDGLDVVFDVPVSDTTDNRSILMRAVDGTRGSTAVEHPSQNIVMGWTPDGSEMLFGSDRGGSMSLWAQPFSERRPQGKPHLIRGDLGGAWSLGVAKDGSLYFGARKNDRDISVTTIDLATGKQVTPAVRPIQKFVGTNLMPDWSSDGRYLAYVSQRGFNPTNNTGRMIGVRDMTTGEERELHPKLLYFGPVSWSPDGTALLTSGTDVRGRTGVFMIDVRTAEVGLVAETILGSQPQWSPDGMRVFYRTGAPAQSSDFNIIERDLASGAERLVMSGSFGVFSISPDGRSIVVPLGDIAAGSIDRVVQISVNSGEMRELLRVDSTERIASFIAPRWTPDGRAVLVRKRSPNELWLVPTTGAPPRKLDVDVRDWSLGGVGQISLHPDGRRIAFLSGTLSNEVMVLENFLPGMSEATSSDGSSTRGDRAVWTGPKVDLFGHVSPDGRFISFTDWSGFNNLSIHDVASNTDRALTGNKGWFREDPNWGQAQWSSVSPDSKYVAYHWLNERLNEIRIVPTARADRKPRTVLKFGAEAAGGVRDWSPDGRLLAIGLEGKDETMKIAVATVADGSIRVLKTTPAWNGADAMFFSRDSRYLAFDLPASDDDDVQQRDVFILAVDGSREVRAVAHGADDRAAGWSPDGKYLLFSSTRTGPRSLWALPVSDGRPQGQPTLVKTDIGSSISLGVTNGGALYLHKYVSERDVKIARIDLQAGTLIGQPRHFTQGLLPVPMVPHFSPDGEYLAYQVRGEEEGLAIRSVKTGEVRRMRNLQYVPDPRWSPDGRSLITQTRIKNRGGVYQIDVNTGKATLIVETAGGSTPRWSPDGKKIYYKVRKPFGDDREIRERDLQSGTERLIFMGDRLVGEMELSPDGQFMAVQMNVDHPATQISSVLLVPLSGDEPRELVRLPASASIVNQWSMMSWTPDSRSLLTARKAGAAVELWLIDIQTGRDRKLNIDTSEWTLADSGPWGGFALSPDGTSIAFMMGKGGAEVWAMENFMQAVK